MNILLAIDASDASQKAVCFVTRTLGTGLGDACSVTLLHVVESLPDFILRRSADPQSGKMYQQVAEEWSADHQRAAENLLSSQKQALIAAGISEANIQTKLVQKEALPEAKKVIAALAIIEEMHSGPYSVVCLGRRGTSPAGGASIGSVAEKVLREARGKTVWVVD